MRADAASKRWGKRMNTGCCSQSIRVSLVAEDEREEEEKARRKQK